MRRLLIIAACAALAACATAPANEGKGLSAAQDAVAAAAQGVHLAYTTGTISKAQVQAAAKLVDKADDVSVAARKAYAAGDINTYNGAIAQINTLAAQIVALEKPQ